MVQCVSCEAEDESHNHLVFQCMLTAQDRQTILIWLSIHREAPGWDEEVMWANTHYKGKQARAKEYRMGCGCKCLCCMAGEESTYLQANNQISNP